VLKNHSLRDLNSQPLSPHKSQSRFIFKTNFKGTYKSKNLGKGKGFGNCGGLL